MQLVAYGAQDVYLTGNPQITFWKVVYRRHTNFAVESIEQVFNGSGDFGKKVVCQIQRNGDLITKMYLRVQLPELLVGQAWVSKVGHAMLKTVELNIGGTTIDKHWGDWFNVWYELARKFAHDRGYDQMIGNTDALTIPNSSAGTPPATLWIPLYFFHCRNDGLALPLIATQYHDTRIEIEFNPLTSLIVGYTDGTNTANNGAITSKLSGKNLAACSLFVDYVYLDSEERKKFAQASHEYLIEQLQFTGSESVNSPNSKFRLNFNHPCKALYWNIQQNQYRNGSSFLAYNPKDWYQTAVNATKRAALMFLELDVATGIYSTNNVTVNPSTNVNSALCTSFLQALGAARVAYVDLSSNSVGMGLNPEIANLIVLGPSLTDDLISIPIEVLVTFFQTSGSPYTRPGRYTNGDASELKDVYVQQYDNYGVFLNGKVNPCEQVLLQLNGQDRFSSRDGMYFNYVQPWQCQSNTPADGINMYSFALNPEEHQPSGTCNMSRIDNATLNINFITTYYVYTDGNANSNQKNQLSNSPLEPSKKSIFNVYATNYNVLRIMSGMAGLAYSN